LLDDHPTSLGEPIHDSRDGPNIDDQALDLPGNRRTTTVAFLVGLSGFVGLLAAGVVRRWYWAFWSILIAFPLGVLRVPVSVLQLTGVLAANGPAWYVVFQGCLA
jgi:hypothetical protein